MFAAAESPWRTPEFDRALAGTRQLLPAFADRVVRTRFVAPRTPSGAWIDYYADWPFALVAADDPLYDLVPDLAAVPGPVVSTTTFSKWGRDLAAATGETSGLVLTGVSTDCCVLSTALAAADAGVRVRVVEDACAGIGPAEHRRAIDAMRLYAPLVEIVSIAELLSAHDVGSGPTRTS